MKFKYIILIIPFITLSHLLFAQSAFDKMNNDKMNKILLREATEVTGQSGNWRAFFNERWILVITDENANRMRVFSPVVEVEKMEEGQFKILLEANFDRALDAKYAIFDNVVWSVFTHPLGELTVEQFKDAMKQVVTLSKNFGTSYTSTDFQFGSGATTEDDQGN